MVKSIQTYHKKLNHYYDSDGKLIQYPSKRPMRILALIKIAEQIDASRKYTEKEINEIIRLSIAFHDIELIRREMYQYGFLGRLRDGSEYWVENDWRNDYAEYIGEDSADPAAGNHPEEEPEICSAICNESLVKQYINIIKERKYSHENIRIHSKDL